VPGQGPVPLALLTTSGSGLDPHLPPAAIAYQLARVAAARNVPVSTLEQLMNAHIEQPLVGPPVVNVLALNMALEKLYRWRRRPGRLPQEVNPCGSEPASDGS
jgi:K+-transporting ATPase ATPase C chain